MTKAIWKYQLRFICCCTYSFFFWPLYLFVFYFTPDNCATFSCSTSFIIGSLFPLIFHFCICRSRSRSYSVSISGSPPPYRDRDRDYSPRHSPRRGPPPARYRSPVRSPPRSVAKIMSSTLSHSSEPPSVFWWWFFVVVLCWTHMHALHYSFLSKKKLDKVCRDCKCCIVLVV